MRTPDTTDPMEEAQKLYASLMDFEADEEAVLQNYDKLIDLREVLVQTFIRRVLELAGPKLAASRLQNPDIPDVARMVDRELIRMSRPFHKLIGSTTNEKQMEVFEKALRGWLGDSVYETLIAELDTMVLAEARLIPATTKHTLLERAANERLRVAELLAPHLSHSDA